ncbi:putative radical SAM protein YgiQ [Hypnocyclicus thermotrophus]|uniref:Radical SAM protein YgiQ n=2 Tax=Hypnocyclicus thermotrophus TaxID=1627895 RepID=A0AA46DXX0_9FUSO|nr:putative radical SAM protein YgiQ [Hypnocyclicus thermotrophus]
MFIPTTKEELKFLKWNQLDIILISGDTYIDSSYNGSAVIGKYLISQGYKVGIIAQPDINSDKDITRLGVPKLYFGVSSGCVDSMVANYTATKKKRQNDDFTPGGINNKRPDRAVIKYVNLIQRYFKGENKRPILIGGIEASLRRIVHYDFWSNSLRKSILFNSKADYLIYGMGEKPILEFSKAIENNTSPNDIRGLCYISNKPKNNFIELPSFEECKSDKYKFIDAFNKFYLNNDPLTAKGLYQKHDNRYLIQNPPAYHLTTKEIDFVYDLKYEKDVHPFYKKDGIVKALDTIKNSVTTHRGCYGECNFCAIAVHQGRTIIQRSEESILKEIESIASEKNFKGYINDIGGPTANMYGIECEKKLKLGSCKNKRCMFPNTCKSLKPSHKKYNSLLTKARKIKNIKKIFIASGIRYDLILSDKNFGNKFLENLIKYHISGQLKIAPEHSEDNILNKMGKQSKNVLVEFKNKFYELNREYNQKQFLTYYLIAAHPGCDENEMKKLKKFASKELRVNPEQVQIFTPTPSTYSTLMYYTEIDPFTGKKIFVEKNINKKYNQKNILINSNNFRKKRRYK